MNEKPLIAPSFLSANFMNLGRDIEMINSSVADWCHMDVMDGVFVPNISFGFSIIKIIKQHAIYPLDVHLMIIDPDRYLERFREAGADILTVHYEACTHLHRTVSKIRDLGMKAGVAINPHTPVEVLTDILPYIDMVLIMSVNPGFGGQKFIPRTYSKIRRLRQMIDSEGYDVLIEVDGGVNLENARDLVRAGVDVLVSGSGIFSTPNPVDTIARMKQIV